MKKKLLVAVLATLVPSVVAFGVTPAEQAAVTRAEQAGTKNWSAQDVADYLPLKRQQDADVPLGERIAHAAMLQKETPYALNARITNNGQSDCWTFVHRSIALGTARSWEEYYRIMSRLVNPSGERNILTNWHFTETWAEGNSWALEDVTDKLGLETKTFQSVVRYKSFLKGIKFGQYDPKTGENDNVEGRKKLNDLNTAIETAPPDRTFTLHYIPKEELDNVCFEIENGDILLLVRTNHKDGLAPWLSVNHVGIACVKNKVYLAQSTAPKANLSEIHDVFNNLDFLVGLRILRPRPNLEAEAGKKIWSSLISVPTPQSVR